MPKIRLLLADDHEDLLREITTLVETDFDVVGTVHDGVSLLEAATRLCPDVVITDFKMPRLSGIDASRELLQKRLCKAIILLTMYADPQLVRSALDAGIRGFVLKIAAGDDLIPAIRSAVRGRTFVSRFASGRVS